MISEKPTKLHFKIWNLCKEEQWYRAIYVNSRQLLNFSFEDNISLELNVFPHFDPLKYQSDNTGRKRWHKKSGNLVIYPAMQS